MDLVGIRTMEFCRRWGIVDWVENCPYPRDYGQDYVWVYSITGWEYGRQTFPTLNEEKPPPASTVRQQLGIPMSGNPVLTYTTNAIFRCPDWLSLHDKGAAYRFIIIQEEGTFATIVAINGRY